MEFKEMFKKTVDRALEYGRIHEVPMDREFAALKLGEEVGEFAQAVLIHDKKCRPEKYASQEEAKNKIAEELADVVGMAMFNAHLYGIDLEKVIRKKWLKEKQD